MSTVLMNDTLNQQNQGQQNPISGQSTAINTGSGVINPQGQASQSSSQPAGSGQFTNLSKFLSANQGVGTNLANQVGGTVQQQAGQVAGEQSKLQSGVGQTIQQETAAQKAAGDVGSAIQNANAKDQQSIANLNQTMSNQGNQAAVQKYINQDQSTLNTANQNLTQGLGTTGTQLQNLGRNVQALGTKTGMANLLQQALNRPSYSQGMNALDQTLMQTEGAQALQHQRMNAIQAYQNALNQQKDIFGMQGQLQNLGSSATALGGNINSAIQKLIGKEGGDSQTGSGILGQAYQAAQTANIQNAADVQTIKDMAAKGIIDPRVASQLTGPTYGAGSQILQDLQTAVVKNPSLAASNMISGDAASLMNTLGTLTKGKTDYTTGDMGAGAGVDISGLVSKAKGDIASQQTAYQNQLKSLWNPNWGVQEAEANNNYTFGSQANRNSFLDAVNKAQDLKNQALQDPSKLQAYKDQVDTLSKWGAQLADAAIHSGTKHAIGGQFVEPLYAESNALQNMLSTYYDNPSIMGNANPMTAGKISFPNMRSILSGGQ